jgi:hypothetical protein
VQDAGENSLDMARLRRVIVSCCSLASQGKVPGFSAGRSELVQ